VFSVNAGISFIVENLTIAANGVWKVGGAK
jgi:hypothetical protein